MRDMNAEKERDDDDWDGLEKTRQLEMTANFALLYTSFLVMEMI